MRLRARSRYLLILFIFLVTAVLATIYLRIIGRKQNDRSKLYRFLSKTDLQTIVERTGQRGTWRSVRRHSNGSCSMASCFNWTKCSSNSPKVYVYPDSLEGIQSSVYLKILRTIRESAYFTDNPEEACLLVLSLDTTDRDKISDNYVKNLNDQIEALPKDVWNGGRNHLIFNLYFGTYPDYADNDLGFNAGNAMIAWASANNQNFRHGFDLSFPLFHKEHPIRSVPKPFNSNNILSDKYLLSFKGKRYVYGIGSETRDWLYHLHNGKSMIIATTCRHNTDWKKFEDARCERDNEEYDRWNYDELMQNSTFCLVPRGRRLGSFRFLEALQAGCIPVVLSDEWVLPFAEVIDWSEAVVRWPEKAVLFAPNYLSSIPHERILHMKRKTQQLYHKYFSSVAKIVLTSIEVVLERIRQANGVEERCWNSFTDLRLFPKQRSLMKWAMVLQGVVRYTSRLNRIVSELSRIQGLDKIVVLWPQERGQPPEEDSFLAPVKLSIVVTKRVDQSEFLKVDLDLLGDVDFVVFLNERVFPPNRTELSRALIFAEEKSEEFVAFYAGQFARNGTEWLMTAPKDDPETGNSIEHSLGLLHYAIVSRSLLSEYQRIYLPTRLARYPWFLPHCHLVLFNVFVADQLVRPPILIRSSGRRVEEPWMASARRNLTICLNKISNQLFDGQFPLLTSHQSHYLT